jgi:hypothetical protein
MEFRISEIGRDEVEKTASSDYLKQVRLVPSLLLFLHSFFCIVQSAAAMVDVHLHVRVGALDPHPDQHHPEENLSVSLLHTFAYLGPLGWKLRLSCSLHYVDKPLLIWE